MAQGTQLKKSGRPLSEEIVYIDPVDEWISANHEEWSWKYPGKYLALMDFQVVAVEDTRQAAFEKLDEIRPGWMGEMDFQKVPTVWYVPKPEELEMVI